MGSCCSSPVQPIPAGENKREEDKPPEKEEEESTQEKGHTKENSEKGNEDEGSSKPPRRQTSKPAAGPSASGSERSIPGSYLTEDEEETIKDWLGKVDMTPSSLEDHTAMNEERRET
eukprot:TRINITY_DN113840_c0_g1_i1.p1 TRINITY_DN113840_c0_g1~~TRINITY_DN113840_c0_g1_i1.p1  ORF type:complete len:117 (-),score=7.43 TRINITY_DN113840_c0_g1_i1:302-652(-)